MARLAGQARWAFQYRVLFGFDPLVHDLINTGVRPIAEAFGPALHRTSGGRVQVVQGISSNPGADYVDTSTWLASECTLRFSVVVLSQQPFDTSVVDAAFAQALKAAHPTFSANRIAAAIPQNGGSGVVDWTPSRAGYTSRCCGSIVRISREQTRVSELATTAPAPATTLRDNAMSTVVNATVADSTRASEVGDRVPGLGEHLPDVAGALWGQIPLGYKVVGGVLLGVAAAALVGYTVRSFRVGVA